MKENIYIDLDEDIQSIIQKIQDSEADNLDLIIPTGARVLQNIVDAHLLKEAGDEYEKKLIVVTSDLMGRIFAERAGLIVLAQTGAGADEDEVIATQAVSTGRISDIVPRRRGVPVRKPAPQKPIKKYEVDDDEEEDEEDEKPSKSKSKSKSLKSGGSRKPSPQTFNPRSKGEIGASFLKSYREERTKASVFKELSHINRRKWKLPFRMSPTIFVVGVSVFTLFIAFVVVAKTLPKAEIIIYPARIQESKTVEVLISSTDSKADFEKGIMPGELLTLEKFESGDFEATGSKNSTDKAKGKITVYNAYASQAQNFVASRFQSENGKIFWATKAFSIPGMNGSTPGQVEIDVIAAETGDSYAIGPSKFTMPALKGTAKGNKIYAVSSNAMTIAKGDGEKVVTNDDISKAYDSLKEKVRPQLQTLRQNLPTGFQLWQEAYNEELAESSSNPEAGETADKFSASVKMIARAVVFKNDDLENYINREISASIEDGKILLPGSKEISFVKPPVVDYQKGSVLATLNVKYDVIDNPDIEGFKNAVLEKDKKEINEITNTYKNIERIEVKYSTFFMGSVPSDPDRVKITISGL
jgi:hypothetical protein